MLLPYVLFVFCMSEVISSFRSLRTGSQVFTLLMLFLCVILHTMSSAKSCDIIFSNIPAGTDSVLRRCRPEGIWCDAAFRMMVRNIFSPFWQLVGSRLLLRLSQLAFFKLKLLRLGIWVIVGSSTN